MPEGKMKESRRGRRPELTEDQIRESMLGAAAQLLDERGGLTLSLDHLLLEDVIRKAGVSRGAVYRLWRRKDFFYADLLEHLAGTSWRDTAAFDQETFDLAESTVREHVDLLQTPDGRRRVLEMAVRKAVARNLYAMSQSAEWRASLALSATLVSFSEEQSHLRDRILNRLRESDERFIREISSFYERMAFVLGLKLRNGIDGDFSSLAILGASIMEGLSVRQMIVPEILSREHSMDSNNEHGNGPWTLPALGFLALLDALTEPVDDKDYDFNGIVAELSSSFVVRLLHDDDPDIQKALDLEQEVWTDRRYGSLETYEKYLSQSRIFVAHSRDRLLGVTQLFAGGPLTPPFIAEMRIPDKALRRELLEGCLDGTVEEMGVTAVLPDAPPIEIAEELWRQAWRDAQKRGIRTWGIIMKPERVQILARKYGLPFEKIGPAIKYQGGYCAPHIMRFSDMYRKMSVDKPKYLRRLTQVAPDEAVQVSQEV